MKIKPVLTVEATKNGVVHCSIRKGIRLSGQELCVLSLDEYTKVLCLVQEIDTLNVRGIDIKQARLKPVAVKGGFWRDPPSGTEVFLVEKKNLREIFFEA